MSYAVVFTRARFGLDAPLVTIEVHLSNGLPQLNMVGLPANAVRESKDRVRSAIINSGFEFPGRRITINMAPADLPKQGGQYDLAIALGILSASGQLSGKQSTEQLARTEWLGELSLDGALRPVQGSLSAAMACAAVDRTLICPLSNLPEAGLSGDAAVLGASTLSEACDFVQQKVSLPSMSSSQGCEEVAVYPELADVQGQPLARRALEVAAAGGHHLLFFGPPGTGKSMLAARLPGLLPPLTPEESLQVARIHSLVAREPLLQCPGRPFAAPHHTATATALVGGGSHPRPGEISLAHHGVLFLDELPEFQRHTLEVLREPLETGRVRISRTQAQLEFPAGFQLVAAMNPCPCGYYGDGTSRCECGVEQVQRYRGRISGPLLDRIDLHVRVASLSAAEMMDGVPQETTASVRERVAMARSRQIARQGCCNAKLPPAEVKKRILLNAELRTLLEQYLQHFGLSARALHRVLRVARTLADLCNEEHIRAAHLQEAFGYRALDRPLRG